MSVPTRCHHPYFFSIAVQRTVQRLVEFACLSVIRVLDSYYQSSPENFEILVDAELISRQSPSTPRWLLPSDRSKYPYAAAARVGHFCAYKSQYHDRPSGSGHRRHPIPNSHRRPPVPKAKNKACATGQGLGGGPADMTVMQRWVPRCVCPCHCQSC